MKALERELISPVKKKRIKLDILSLDEAITQMELLGHDFFIYRNEDKEVSRALLAGRRQIRLDRNRIEPRRNPPRIPLLRVASSDLEGHYSFGAPVKMS
ncbi:MAG: sigma 54 modulation/S30EA ribosomal C-terminal domain-containing protein [Bacillus subtilis]|nr:sigma 54 modulation/S30EA ribosomal C-terminal domain-containing protein [Bacillus subtilis]